MKEAAASSSPFYSPKTPNAGAAAAGSPAGKQTPPAIRVKSFGCSTSLSSSPSSSVNSSNSSSPFYSSHLGSPMVPASPFCSSSAIPFSWEKQPGVPKQSHQAKEQQRRGDRSTLPPPPPLRSNSDPFVSLARKKRPELRFLADPFAVALMECSKEGRREDDDDVPGLYWKGTAAASKVVGGRRRSIADLFGFVDMYTSCKTTCSVADSTVCIPRSGRGMAAYGLLSRRAG